MSHWSSSRIYYFTHHEKNLSGMFLIKRKFSSGLSITGSSQALHFRGPEKARGPPEWLLFLQRRHRRDWNHLSRYVIINQSLISFVFLIDLFLIRWGSRRGLYSSGRTHPESHYRSREERDPCHDGKKENNWTVSFRTDAYNRLSRTELCWLANYD